MIYILIILIMHLEVGPNTNFITSSWEVNNNWGAT